MVTEKYLTGNKILTCQSCASQVSIRLDDRWEYDESIEGYYKITASHGWPKFCPSCGTMNVLVEEEQLDFWLYCARVADWKVSPQSIALMKQLHASWLSTKAEFFVELLRDFKASVTASKNG